MEIPVVIAPLKFLLVTGDLSDDKMASALLGFDGHVCRKLPEMPGMVQISPSHHFMTPIDTSSSVEFLVPNIRPGEESSGFTLVPSENGADWRWEKRGSFHIKGLKYQRKTLLYRGKAFTLTSIIRQKNNIVAPYFRFLEYDIDANFWRQTPHMVSDQRLAPNSLMQDAFHWRGHPGKILFIAMDGVVVCYDLKRMIKVDVRYNKLIPDGFGMLFLRTSLRQHRLKR